MMLRESYIQNAEELVAEKTALEESYDVSLVIPVYNHSSQIPLTVQYLKGIMDRTGLSYELIIVDDGSTDNTLEILKKELLKDSRIRVFSYPMNKGKGYAIKTGVMKSNAKIDMFIDADLDISPNTIIDYIRELDSCDLVIASKSHPLSKINAPLSRRILSRCFRFFVRLMINLDIRDTQSGLKGGDANVLRLLFGEMMTNRYAFDVELLALARSIDLRIKEMPVEINIDRRFKIKDMAIMFRDLLKISYRYKIKSRVKKLVDLYQLNVYSRTTRY